MVLFPNCKINIGLNVIAKRPDGYHDIETVFYPVNWCDALELMVPSQTNSVASGVQFSYTGLPVPGIPANNICLKAYYLLKKDFPQLPPISLHLHKCIPTGAGLGGGSSDGAFTLELINTKCKLNLSQQQLSAYALQLGSDCPFFIFNTPVYATGRGEAMEPVDLDLSAFSFLIIHPGIHIPTAWAFSQLHPTRPAKSAKHTIQQPITTWRNELTNDFELPVFQEYPQIAAIKASLYAAGALYASLSGSGSAVYGIFTKNEVPELNWDQAYSWKIIL